MSNSTKRTELDYRMAWAATYGAAFAMAYAEEHSAITEPIDKAVTRRFVALARVNEIACADVADTAVDKLRRYDEQAAIDAIAKGGA